MVAELMAQLPQTITTHGFRFRLMIKYGVKQLYPISDIAERTLFVGYFLTEVVTTSRKKRDFYKKYGVWKCERLAEKQRLHQFTDALLAIPMFSNTDNEELEMTLQCLARTLVNEVNHETSKMKEISV